MERLAGPFEAQDKLKRGPYTALAQGIYEGATLPGKTPATVGGRYKVRSAPLLASRAKARPLHCSKS